MGFSLSKISPITFDVDSPQTPANSGIKGRALTSTPSRKMRLHNHTMKQQTSMRPTMSLVVTLHTAQMNPLQTNKSKEDSSHQKQIT